MEVLTEEECWRLLGTQEVGRVAVSAAGVLDIFPVNYHVDARSILFRTAPGDKLVQLTINANIAFEVDSLQGPVVWSVVAKGPAYALEDQAEIDRAEELPLHPWAPTPKIVYVRIAPATISGRRFEKAAPQAPRP